MEKQQSDNLPDQQSEQQFIPSVARLLYDNNRCLWPGCDRSFESVTEFMNHLQTFHGDSNANQAALYFQCQLVQFLQQMTQSESHIRNGIFELITYFLDEIQARRYANLNPTVEGLANAAGNNTFQLATDSHIANSQHFANDEHGIQESLAINRFESTIENELEAYRNINEKPPFTYAALIRQAIRASENQSLTLSEIYLWLENNFLYFRQNSSLWKNAVRHNLSKHECFFRTLNIRGSVWAVNEQEYNRRRPQRRSNARATARMISSRITITAQDIAGVIASTEVVAHDRRTDTIQEETRNTHDSIERTQR